MNGWIGSEVGITGSDGSVSKNKIWRDRGVSRKKESVAPSVTSDSWLGTSSDSSLENSFSYGSGIMNSEGVEIIRNYIT